MHFLLKELTINSHEHLEDNHLCTPVLSPPPASRNPSPAHLQLLLSGPLKTAALEPREQLYKQSVAPTLPRWFTQLRNSFSPHIAGRADKAQMAQDLHLHECFSEFSTQATLRQRSPMWGDERHPRHAKNCFQGLGFSTKNARTFCIQHHDILHSTLRLFLYYDIVSLVFREDVPLLSCSCAQHSPSHPPSTHTQILAQVTRT